MEIEGWWRRWKGPRKRVESGWGDRKREGVVGGGGWGRDRGRIGEVKGRRWAGGSEWR